MRVTKEATVKRAREVGVANDDSRGEKHSDAALTQSIQIGSRVKARRGARQRSVERCDRLCSGWERDCSRASRDSRD